jgi:NAD(P)-dependent dehydrogenase (short-subunit alcohol dehydrogenase family)
MAGKRVAVTGGAQGIGRALAEHLVAGGASVVVGDVDLGLAEKTAGAIGHGTVALELDVSDRTRFATFLDDAAERLGGLDVLVNNAGIMPLGPFLDEDDAVTDRIVDVDLRGVLIGSKLAGRRFREQGHGHVVNIASVLGMISSPHAATYCATKHAVIGLGDALRQEWRGSGVALSTVCPGFVRTELIAGLPTTPVIDRFLMVDPDDIARATTEVIARGRSRTVAVPLAAGAGGASSRLLPAGVRDRLFRAVGGHKVTENIDQRARGSYRERVERGLS